MSPLLATSPLGPLQQTQKKKCCTQYPVAGRSSIRCTLYQSIAFLTLKQNRSYKYTLPISIALLGMLTSLNDLCASLERGSKWGWTRGGKTREEEDAGGERLGAEEDLAPAQVC